MTLIVEKNIGQGDLKMLQQAFLRFSETGRALEEKYRELQAEAVELRAALHEKELEIKRNERLAILGKTAAAIAHEIRNPLGAIKLFLSMLKDDMVDKPESLQLMTHVNASVERLEATVSNILQFSRDKAPRFAPLNLHSIIKEQVEQFQLTKGRTLKFSCNLRASSYISGNEDGIRRIFFNLFVNAVQALKGDGEICIETEDDGADKVRIAVRDNGPGIAPEVADSIFEPFITTRNEGTGLGLAIVKQIIEQHSGSIEVQSRNGAEFNIMLPRAR